MPAAIDSAWLHCLSSAPNADAVAPRPTKTVEKPATNKKRGDENVAPRLRLALVDQRFDARAREIAKIGRRERQHAGRNKGDEARAERGGKGDVGHGRDRWSFDAGASNVDRKARESGQGRATD